MNLRYIQEPDPETVAKYGYDNAKHFCLIDYERDYNIHLLDPLFDKDMWPNSDKVRVWWTEEQLKRAALLASSTGDTYQ